MNVRQRVLPAGWYPENAAETRRILDSWSAGEGPKNTSLVSGIVPHAGWAFSGELAFSVLRRMGPDTEIVVIAGGHLLPGDRVLAMEDDALDTPLGAIRVERELLSSVIDTFHARSDTSADNTVEVQLPMIRYLVPEARVVGIRVSPGSVAIELGRHIARWAADRARSVAVVGSTDLTHYGPAYGFAGHGSGKEAVAWATEENDAPFIDSMLRMDFEEALGWANTHRAACSAGGAVTAGAYAAETGVEHGKLVDHTTSYERARSDSFVGYAGIAYEREVRSRSQSTNASSAARDTASGADSP